jgi:hypothetical protein
VEMPTAMPSSTTYHHGGMPDPGHTATYLANDAVEEEAILDGPSPLANSAPWR